jgi:hypothetical protein
MHTPSLLIVALSLTLAACGGDTKTVTVAAEDPVAVQDEGADGCAARGIDDAGGRTGTCKTPDGTTLTVVDRRGTLRLADHALRLVRVSTASTIKAAPMYAPETFKAKGRFVIMRFRVENRSSQPLNWSGSLGVVALDVGGARYTATHDEQAYHVAARALKDGNAGNAPIQPRTTEDRWVVFDLPPSVASSVGERGSSIRAVSADDALNSSAAADTDNAETRGEIRLWR